MIVAEKYTEENSSRPIQKSAVEKMTDNAGALSVEADMSAQIGVDPVFARELSRMTNGRTDSSCEAPKRTIELTKSRARSRLRKIRLDAPPKRLVEH